jgi:hypothetical protein
VRYLQITGLSSDQWKWAVEISALKLVVAFVVDVFQPRITVNKKWHCVKLDKI